MRCVGCPLQTPVIVAICVGPALDDWHHYTGGVFDQPCCEKKEEITLDHGIVVVGYGTEGDTPYWILKNRCALAAAALKHARQLAAQHAA